MHIRFISTFEPPNTIFRDLLPFLAKNGDQVEVVISRVAYRDERGSLVAAMEASNVRVVRIPAGVNRRSGLLRRFWIDFTFAVGTALRTLVGPGSDLNVILSQPPLFSIWGSALKVLRGQPYVCLTMDVYPDIAVADGLMTAESKLTRLLTWVARRGWRSAAAVIVMGRCMADRIVDHGVARQRIRNIPNWAGDLETLIEGDLRRAVHIEEELVILYSGNMGVSHTFGEILEVASRLHDRRDVRFVFIGDGARQREIEQAMALPGVHNITLLPFQPAALLAESLALGHLHHVTLRSGFEGVVVPSKAYGPLAVGRPLLYVGESEGEIARLITENDVGTALLPGDVDGLERAILGYLESPSRLKEQGERARHLSASVTSREKGLALYAEAFAAALAEGRTTLE